MVTRALAIGVAASLVPAALAAHTGQAPAPHDLATAWSREPLVWAGLVIGVAAYTRGVRDAWRRAGRGRVFGAQQLRAAWLALAALVVALISPVDALGGALFAGHMVQHMLLIAVAAPLLVQADAGHALLRALPVRHRRGMVRGLRRSGAWAAWQLLAHPLAAFLLHAGTVWFWHLPRYYDAAVYHEGLHALEHITMLGTALLFWGPVLGSARRSRMPSGFAILYLFGFGMQASLLGALLTFANGAWYAAHLESVAAWGLTALEDQQLAGVVMWVPGSIAYIAAAARVFLRWMHELEARSPGRRAGSAGTSAEVAR